MKMNENAPSRRGSTAATAASSEAEDEMARDSTSPLAGCTAAESSRSSSAATSSATRSLSLATVPGSIPASSASCSVLTRLPLWPSANCVSPTPR